MLNALKGLWERIRPTDASPHPSDEHQWNLTEDQFDRAPIARSCLEYGENGEIYYKVVKEFEGGLVLSRTKTFKAD